MSIHALSAYVANVVVAKPAPGGAAGATGGAEPEEAGAPLSPELQAIQEEDAAIQKEIKVLEEVLALVKVRDGLDEFTSYLTGTFIPAFMPIYKEVLIKKVLGEDAEITDDNLELAQERAEAENPDLIVEAEEEAIGQIPDKFSTLATKLTSLFPIVQGLAKTEFPHTQSYYDNRGIQLAHNSLISITKDLEKNLTEKLQNMSSTPTGALAIELLKDHNAGFDPADADAFNKLTQEGVNKVIEILKNRRRELAEKADEIAKKEEEAKKPKATAYDHALYKLQKQWKFNSNVQVGASKVDVKPKKAAAADSHLPKDLSVSAEINPQLVGPKESGEDYLIGNLDWLEWTARAGVNTALDYHLSDEVKLFLVELALGTRVKFIPKTYYAQPFVDLEYAFALQQIKNSSVYCPNKLDNTLAAKVGIQSDILGRMLSVAPYVVYRHSFLDHKFQNAISDSYHMKGGTQLPAAGIEVSALLRKDPDNPLNLSNPYGYDHPWMPNIQASFEYSFLGRTHIPGVLQVGETTLAEGKYAVGLTEARASLMIDFEYLSVYGNYAHRSFSGEDANGQKLNLPANDEHYVVAGAVAKLDEFGAGDIYAQYEYFEGNPNAPLTTHTGSVAWNLPWLKKALLVGAFAGPHGGGGFVGLNVNNLLLNWGEPKKPTEDPAAPPPPEPPTEEPPAEEPPAEEPPVEEPTAFNPRQYAEEQCGKHATSSDKDNCITTCSTQTTAEAVDQCLFDNGYRFE